METMKIRIMELNDWAVSKEKKIEKTDWKGRVECRKIKQQKIWKGMRKPKKIRENKRKAEDDRLKI